MQNCFKNPNIQFSGVPCNSPGLPPHERADQLPEGPEDEEGHGGEGPDLPGLSGHAEHTQA